MPDPRLEEFKELIRFFQDPKNEKALARFSNTELLPLKQAEEISKSVFHSETPDMTIDNGRAYKAESMVTNLKEGRSLVIEAHSIEDFGGSFTQGVDLKTLAKKAKAGQVDDVAYTRLKQVKNFFQNNTNRSGSGVTSLRKDLNKGGADRMKVKTASAPDLDIGTASLEDLVRKLPDEKNKISANGGKGFLYKERHFIVYKSKSYSIPGMVCKPDQNPWKIHISIAEKEQMNKLISIVKSTVVDKYDSSFKSIVPESFARFQKPGYHNAGKIVTIYPKDFDTAKKIISDLDNVLNSSGIKPAPLPPGDLQVASHLSVRDSYGLDGNYNHAKNIDKPVVDGKPNPFKKLGEEYQSKALAKQVPVQKPTVAGGVKKLPAFQSLKNAEDLAALVPKHGYKAIIQEYGNHIDFDDLFKYATNKNASIKTPLGSHARLLIKNPHELVGYFITWGKEAQLSPEKIQQLQNVKTQLDRLPPVQIPTNSTKKAIYDAGRFLSAYGYEGFIAKYGKGFKLSRLEHFSDFYTKKDQARSIDTVEDLLVKQYGLPKDEFEKLKKMAVQDIKVSTTHAAAIPQKSSVPPKVENFFDEMANKPKTTPSVKVAYNRIPHYTQPAHMLFSGELSAGDLITSPQSSPAFVKEIKELIQNPRELAEAHIRNMKANPQMLEGKPLPTVDELLQKYKNSDEILQKINAAERYHKMSKIERLMDSAKRINAALGKEIIAQRRFIQAKSAPIRDAIRAYDNLNRYDLKLNFKSLDEVKIMALKKDDLLRSLNTAKLSPLEKARFRLLASTGALTNDSVAGSVKAVQYLAKTRSAALYIKSLQVYSGVLLFMIGTQKLSFGFLRFAWRLLNTKGIALVDFLFTDSDKPNFSNSRTLSILKPLANHASSLGVIKYFDLMCGEIGYYSQEIRNYMKLDKFPDPYLNLYNFYQYIAYFHHKALCLCLCVNYNYLKQKFIKYVNDFDAAHRALYMNTFSPERRQIFDDVLRKLIPDEHASVKNLISNSECISLKKIVDSLFLRSGRDVEKKQKAILEVGYMMNLIVQTYTVIWQQDKQNNGALSIKGLSPGLDIRKQINDLASIFVRYIAYLEYNTGGDEIPEPAFLTYVTNYYQTINSEVKLIEKASVDADFKKQGGVAKSRQLTSLELIEHELSQSADVANEYGAFSDSQIETFNNYHHEYQKAVSTFVNYLKGKDKHLSDEIFKISRYTNTPNDWSSFEFSFPLEISPLFASWKLAEEINKLNINKNPKEWSKVPLKKTGVEVPL